MGAPGRVEKPMLISDILFDFDKADIRASETDKIKEAAAYMAKNPTGQLSLNGNADPRGTSPYNMALSKRRVENVRAALVAAGVAPDRIQTQAFGEDRPKCTEQTEECWQRDRRVEVWVGLASQASR
jgi:peptidoglycan-associated lipoprotein